MVVNYDMLTGADSYSRTSQRRGRARRRKQATEGMRLSSVQRTSKKKYVNRFVDAHRVGKIVCLFTFFVRLI